MLIYASLARFRERLGIPAGDADTDRRLLAALRGATAQIDRFTARRFAPVVHTRHYPFQSAYTLRLDLDLLELRALANPDGAAIDISAVRLLPEGASPAVALALPGAMPFQPGASPEALIAVTGVWGTHDAWDSAWRASGDAVQDAALDEAAALITVADADDADALGDAPRFEAGQLIRLEDEYLHVVGVDAEANTLSVIRGVRGTTAAAHDAGTPIAIYAAPEDVQALCLRWAAWLYAQVDAGIGAGADWLYPATLPDDLHRLAAPLRYLRAA